MARKKFVSLCTNALLLEKKLHLFEPSPYLFFSVHLDGLREHHDKSVCQEGVFDRAVSAIKAAKAKGFAVNVNATIFDGHPAEDIAAFLDYAKELGVGVSISPGYAYERAPDQEHFLSRRKTKELFRKVFGMGKGKKWKFIHSTLFLDFLAGNQTYHCTPWGMPTRNIFGWQKPCYLLGEGYAKTFRELMETTDWDSYGTGKYEKCANCMAHCGYEATAAEATVAKPWQALKVALLGVRTAGADGAGNPARPAAAGGIRFLAPRRARACRHSSSKKTIGHADGSGGVAPSYPALRSRCMGAAGGRAWPGRSASEIRRSRSSVSERCHFCTWLGSIQMIITFRTPPSGHWRSSGCDSAPAPRAGRISDSRGSADRTRAGSRSRCSAPRPRSRRCPGCFDR